MDDEGEKFKTVLILGHGVIGQGQLCPIARGCHALCCLVLFSLGFQKVCVSLGFGGNLFMPQPERSAGGI